ncbi:MAG: cytidylate kinase-like family protein [Clostridia bacterium]|nr:cytidylate kinase-like family protein [Clostridia bacterium]
MKTVITIGRQFGSGGHEIGEKLAKEFGIPFYDKELVEMAAEKSNLHKEVLEDIDERATNSLLFSLVTGNSMRGANSPVYYEMTINDRLFIAQSEVIKKVASEGPCVIVGRCADYVLEDSDIPTVNVFIYSNLKFRIDRISKECDLSPEKAKEKIIKIEKRRKAYYNYYSNREWGKIENYDICINSGDIGVDNAVKVIKLFVEMKDMMDI